MDQRLDSWNAGGLGGHGDKHTASFRRCRPAPCSCSIRVRAEGERGPTRSSAALAAAGLDPVVGARRRRPGPGPGPLLRHAGGGGPGHRGRGRRHPQPAVQAPVELGLPLAILPLGTANNLARTLGIPARPAGRDARCGATDTGRDRPRPGERPLLLHHGEHRSQRPDHRGAVGREQAALGTGRLRAHRAQGDPASPIRSTPTSPGRAARATPARCRSSSATVGTTAPRSPWRRTRRDRRRATSTSTPSRCNHWWELLEVAPFAQVADRRASARRWKRCEDPRLRDPHPDAACRSTWMGSSAASTPRDVRGRPRRARGLRDEPAASPDGQGALARLAVQRPRQRDGVPAPAGARHRAARRRRPRAGAARRGGGAHLGRAQGGERTPGRPARLACAAHPACGYATAVLVRPLISVAERRVAGGRIPGHRPGREGSPDARRAMPDRGGHAARAAGPCVRLPPRGRPLRRGARLARGVVPARARARRPGRDRLERRARASSPSWCSRWCFAARSPDRLAARAGGTRPPARPTPPAGSSGDRCCCSPRSRFFRLPEALLLLRLQDLGVAVAVIPLVWAGLHVVQERELLSGRVDLRPPRTARRGRRRRAAVRGGRRCCSAGDCHPAWRWPSSSARGRSPG